MRTPTTLLVVAAAIFPPTLTHSIHCDPKSIPKANFNLPILSLGKSVSVPNHILNQVIHASSPQAQINSLDDHHGHSSRPLVAHDGDRLVAYVDPNTGETTVFPSLSSLKPASSISIDSARNLLSDRSFFPRDDSQLSIVIGSRLMGQQSTGNDTSAPQAYLTNAYVNRTVASGHQHLPVCGPGSKASFSYGADGNIHSLSFNWKPARMTRQKVSTVSLDQVHASILQQLAPSANIAPVRVDSIDLCLYDSGNKFIQPVYRFRATLHADSAGNTTTSPTLIQGYVPASLNPPEPVPELNTGSSNQVMPSTPSTPRNVTVEPPTFNVTKEKRQLPSVTVGRYVVREDDQYYWAEPRLFTTEKDTFINSVQIAETEVHGNWHYFTTLKNCCDGVNLETDIPSSGYGRGAGGSLAYWILHSCEVIPSPYDYNLAGRKTSAFDTWFSIFNGMHAAVGYRTEMSIADHIMPQFGTAVSIGASFVDSWMSIVGHDSQDYVPPIIYLDNNVNINEARGKASAVAVCGHEGDTIRQTENLGRPECLQMWWYEN